MQERSNRDRSRLAVPLGAFRGGNPSGHLPTDRGRAHERRFPQSSFLPAISWRGDGHGIFDDGRLGHLHRDRRGSRYGDFLAAGLARPKQKREIARRRRSRTNTGTTRRSLGRTPSRSWQETRFVDPRRVIQGAQDLRTIDVSMNPSTGGRVRPTPTPPTPR